MRSLIIGLLAGTLTLLLMFCGCIDVPDSETPVVPRVTLATPVPTAPPQAGPSGVTWYLVSFTDGNTSVNVIPGTVITAFFDGQETVSGSAGCNQYSTVYSGNRTGLVIAPPASTKMNCESPAGIMSQETLYLTALSGASTYSVIGHILTVNDSRGESILTYSSIPTGTAAPPPLIGTRWYLNTFTDSSGNTWTPGRLTTITLLFSPNGNTYGNSGCNEYVASYQLGSGNTVSFSNPGGTVMFCGIGGVMELETAYLMQVPEMTRYTISEQQLVLSDATGKMTMLFDSKHQE
jgi:heat shock protein HslJ